MDDALSGVEHEYNQHRYDRRGIPGGGLGGEVKHDLVPGRDDAGHARLGRAHEAEVEPGEDSGAAGA